MNLSDWAALCGMASGVAAITLSIVNYLRDKPQVKVTLQWDMKVLHDPMYDSSKLWGLITVTNTGRRPIYISHVRLRLPNAAEDPVLLLYEGIKGLKLEEGGPRHPFIASQDGFEKYAPYWRTITAEVSDSAGKTWRSKRANKSLGRPSWARQA